jgi:hypothetical protein
VTLPPGAKAAMHSHPDHIAVSMTGGTVRMTMPDGTSSDAPLEAEGVSLQPAGAHGTANPGAAAHEVIVIELKGAPGKAQLPSSRPGMTSKQVFTHERAVASRTSIDASFHEPAGSTHDYDQVVITLAPSDVALTMEGKTTSSWKRGDVRLIGRGVAHETKGGQVKGDMLIVTIR